MLARRKHCFRFPPGILCPAMNAFRPILISLVPALLLLTSCIEFDRQTLTYHYDEDLDVLRIFQQYEGISGSDKEAGISNREKTQLQSLHQHQRTFFFANWIWEYNEDEMRKMVSAPLSKAKEEGPPTPQELASHRTVQAFAQQLLNHVRVENGAFYRNNAGELCAYQRVTVNRVSGVLGAANLAIRQQILNNHVPDNISPDSRRKLQRAAEENHAFIQLNGNELRFHWPMAPIDFGRMKKQWGQRIESALQSDDPAGKDGELAWVKSLMEQDIWISYLDETLVVAAGYPSNTQTRVHVDLNKSYRDNIGAHVEGSFGVEQDLNLGKIKQDFLLGL